MMHLDGWKSVLSGLGIMGIDKQKSMEVDNAYMISEGELVELYKGEGIANRIINMAADDMIRNGWEIPNDKDGKLYTMQQKLGVQPALGTAMRWARLFGGSLVLMMHEGGGPLMAPIDPAKDTRAKLKGLRVYPCTRIRLDPQDIGTNFESEYFETYEYYTIVKKDGTSFKVHASRCLVFHGIPYPDSSFEGATERAFWGMSVLQPAWDALTALGATIGVVPTLTEEFSVGVFRLSNLEQILMENDVKALYDRMTQIAASKSALKAVILGKDEEFTRNTLQFTGLPEIIDRLFMMLAGITGYPVTRLFGRSAAGQNATGEEDSRNYYDMVKAGQLFELLPNLTKIVQWCNISLGSPVKDEDISIDFMPVWEPSQLQLVEMIARQAAADQIYLETGVLSQDEVRQMRFSGSYSFNSSLEDISESGSKAPGLPEQIPATIGTAKSSRATPTAKPAALPNKARKR